MKTKTDVKSNDRATQIHFLPLSPLHSFLEVNKWRNQRTTHAKWTAHIVKLVSAEPVLEPSVLAPKPVLF